MKTEKTDCDHVYCHINNGGITFSIEKYTYTDEENPNYNRETPVLKISASHFGHQTNEMKLQFTPDNLQSLGIWLINESKRVRE